ncbi:hypothetical protein PO909_026402 [Leuciscus waleckii]
MALSEAARPDRLPDAAGRPSILNNTTNDCTLPDACCHYLRFFFSFFHYFLIHPSLAGVTPINESRPQVNTALASESIPVTCNTNTQKLHLQKIDIVLQTCPITTLSLLLYSSADINALSCEHIVTGEYSA